MIIGKSLTALGSGGLKPEITVTAKAGALLNLHFKDSSIILQSYQLRAEETQHTFIVNASETAYVVEDVTNGKSVEVLVDAVAVFVVEISYLPLYIVKDGTVQNGVQFEVSHENYNSSMYGTVSYDPLYIYRHGNGTTKLTTSVNLTGASKICATVSKCSTNDVETNYARFGVLADALTSYTSFGKNTSASSISPVLDVTSLAGVNTVGMFLKSNAIGTFPSVTVKDFWIE